jgi:hypothetical protein
MKDIKRYEKYAKLQERVGKNLEKISKKQLKKIQNDKH